MKLIYNNKSIDIKDCNTFFSRLKGFMFDKKIETALLFNKCNSIHTFFMKQNIDVIMCDKDNKIIWPKKIVYKTIELPVNYFDIKTNEKIRID